eukprot:NODE_2290_length_1095_cov_27.241736_g2272_i0.p1 GENE.NODE_2290_length_1095_cov_27.241736_g2272_i0~~NODE_2290_length_1095_cov_27.241736_g2272_i0.p1  ORF type:complete len:191 (-),score=9.25 NODE_2290_length_1095_cov_27.241736_g2272_i0:66-638(-)
MSITSLSRRTALALPDSMLYTRWGNSALHIRRFAFLSTPEHSSGCRIQCRCQDAERECTDARDLITWCSTPSTLCSSFGQQLRSACGWTVSLFLGGWGIVRESETDDWKILKLLETPGLPVDLKVMRQVGQLPSTGDSFGNEGFDDTEEDRVLTQDELRAQTEARLASKDEMNKARDAKRGKGKKKKHDA